jgi:hypothetical protein
MLTPNSVSIGLFSLVDHLDLELDIDEEMEPFIQQEQEQGHTQAEHLPAQAIQSRPPTATPTPHQRTTTTTLGPSPVHIRAHQTKVIDPKTPMFFPSARTSDQRAVKTFFDAAKVASSAFYRTETEEQIRERWEKCKGDLTTGWKKRWREAGKLRRRRGNAGASGDLVD